MSSLFKFRKYKIKQGRKNLSHPKLIVDEHKNEFGFMGLTSSKHKGKRHNNFPLINNPQTIDGKRVNNKSFLRRKIEYDDKSTFGKILKDYTLSNIDEIRVREFIKKKLKK